MCGALRHEYLLLVCSSYIDWISVQSASITHSQTYMHQQGCLAFFISGPYSQDFIEKGENK